MKTLQKTIYVTDDNKEFTCESDALAYQASLENEVLIDDFLASLVDKTEQAKARMRNDITKFLGFQSTYVIPGDEPEAAEEETEEAA